LIYCRGVKTVQFQAGLDDKNKILQGCMYATFFKFAKKNETGLFVIAENEDDENSSLMTKIETF
jgi:hypothetical protein